MCADIRQPVFSCLKEALGGEPMSYTLDASLPDIQVDLVKTKPAKHSVSPEHTGVLASPSVCSLANTAWHLIYHQSLEVKCFPATDQSLGSPHRDFCPLLFTELVEGSRALLHDQAAHAAASQLDLGQDFDSANPKH